MKNKFLFSAIALCCFTLFSCSEKVELPSVDDETRGPKQPIESTTLHISFHDYSKVTGPMYPQYPGVHQFYLEVTGNCSPNGSKMYHVTPGTIFTLDVDVIKNSGKVTVKMWGAKFSGDPYFCSLNMQARNAIHQVYNNDTTSATMEIFGPVEGDDTYLMIAAYRP